MNRPHRNRPHRSRDPLVRRILKAERGLCGYRPTGNEPPAEPPGADEVLAALAATYRPGDAIAVPWEKARAVRAWAERVGAWPYVRPGPCRPPAGRDPAMRKGGAGT